MRRQNTPLRYVGKSVSETEPRPLLRPQTETPPLTPAPMVTLTPQKLLNRRPVPRVILPLPLPLVIVVKLML